MKTKRILSFIFILTLSLHLFTFPALADEIMPRWDNISRVILVHGLYEGDAHCNVTINGYSGTDKIDNINIELYRIAGNALILVEQWEDLSVTGATLDFYGIAEDVEGGYTYRLAVTADVHRYGLVEHLDTYGDVVY